MGILSTETGDYGAAGEESQRYDGGVAYGPAAARETVERAAGKPVEWVLDGYLIRLWRALASGIGKGRGDAERLLARKGKR